MTTNQKDISRRVIYLELGFLLVSVLIIKAIQYFIPMKAMHSDEIGGVISMVFAASVFSALNIIVYVARKSSLQFFAALRVESDTQALVVFATLGIVIAITQFAIWAYYSYIHMNLVRMIMT